MIDTNRIAAPLRQAAEAGDIPGVVAAAATRDGSFSRTVLASAILPPACR